MRILELFLMLIFISLGGCARHADQKSIIAPQNDFGSVIDDTELTFDQLKPVKPSVFSQDSIVILSSKDWFTLSDLLLDDAVVNPQLGRLGEGLLKSFYSIPHSATTMSASISPPGSPFGEAAVWFAKPILTKTIEELFETAEKKVSLAADTITVDLSELTEPYPLPEMVLERIISSLQSFREKLVGAKSAESDPVIDSIVSNLDSKYIGDLQELQKSVTWNDGEPFLDGLKSLLGTLGHISGVTDFQRRHLVTQVGLAVALEQENFEANDSESFLAFIGNLWLSTHLRSIYPEKIKNIFDGLTDQQIISLATLNEEEIIPAAEWQPLVTATSDSIDTIPLPDRTLIALYSQNHGKSISPEAWNSLSEKSQALDELLDDPEYSEFSRVMANVPSEIKAEQRFALVSGWLAIPERLGVPDELRELFKTFTDKDISLVTSKSSLTWNTGKAASSVTKAIEDIHISDYIPDIHLLSPRVADKVVGAFNGLDHNVKSLTERNSVTLTPHPVLVTARRRIIESLQGENVVSENKKKFEDAVKKATRERLDLALVPTAKELSSQIKDALIPTLKEKSKQNRHNVASTINQYGRYYLGKLVFHFDGLKKNDPNPDPKEEAQLRQKTLPLLENGSVQYSFKNQKWIESGNPETSAELLGLSLSILPKRIELLKEAGADSQEAVAMEYQMVCKLLAIAGYHDPSGNLVESLSVAMDSKHAEDFLEIAKYDPAKVVFATPDVLKIHGDFRLDSVSRIDPSVSVAGQMSLLRGYSALMKFLKPWKPSIFDGGLGGLRVDEEADLVPFNRADYFLLSTGLGAAILKNIPFKMLSLITSDNKFIDATKLEDPTQVSARGAVITGYTRQGFSHEVKTKDLAQSILAMAEFYRESADLNLSSAPLIIASVEGDKLTAARKTLQKLIAGMILFSSSHLMADDGGFASGFDLDKMQVEEGSRSLTDQLLMEQALVTAGKIFGSGFMISRALDNFFFLNKKFWSEKLGFYRDSENSKLEKYSLINVARGIKIVKEMLSLDVTQSPKSRSAAQMGKLIELWTARFFSSETLGLDPVTLLSEFSL